MAGLTQPALLPPAEAAAGAADVKLAVQTLTLDVDQEPEGLKAADAVGLGQAAPAPQQLPLGVFFLYFTLQFAGKQPDETRTFSNKS